MADVQTISSSVKSIRFKRGRREKLIETLCGENRPLRGEPIWETDTNLLKIGDGNLDYVALPYLTSEDGGSVYKGYLFEGRFYYDEEHLKPISKSEKALYIDEENVIYIYNEKTDSFIAVSAKVKPATAQEAGIMKLYTELGINEDGTMTQKAIKGSIDAIGFSLDNEGCLILNK